ncbi:hypothetical protein JKA74_09290 [Marivirga sp. S37H4]|uniref:Uncharacterized protein n=1 Tax=Marivirga aurantiaca TaxID=2802615 RepID=A0A934WYH1_9BACT|nr:hypothetical protein [Marivirga aurantiaca]MBK6265232.1 hypothetical protein [Marivirga aurantiaca]
MRNIIYKIFIIVGLVNLTSCFEEEVLTDQLKEGANVAVSGTSTYLNGETTEVTLELDFQESDNAQIKEVQVTKQLVTAQGNSDVVSLDPVNESGELNFTTQELLADVPVNGVILSESDLSPGDRWVFSFTILMEDGRSLIPLQNADWAINFSCPSVLAGIYNSVASGSFGDGAGGSAGAYAGLNATVELTQTATDGVYSIDDMSFGLYPQGYGDTAPSGRIRDICNDLNDLGDTDQYGDPFTMNGTVNADGTIDLEWSNTWGDGGTVTLTPAG